MSEQIDAGRLNKAVHVLELRETAPGAWEWGPIRRTWTMLTLQTKKNLFSSVGTFVFPIPSGIGGKDGATPLQKYAGA